jgi:hypothetical protein
MQRGLDLANWDGEDAATFYRLEERLLIGGEWTGTILQPRERRDDDRHAGQFYRDILIRELSTLLRGPKGKLLETPARLRPREADPGVRTPLDVPPLSRSREQLARSNHGSVAAIGVAWKDGARTEFGWVMRPAHLHAAIDTVMWLLSARDLPFASELRQCEWLGCFNFFLAEKPKAGPRRRYCSTGCMEAMHRHNAPRRKAAMKARRAKKTKTNRLVRSTR